MKGVLRWIVFFVFNNPICNTKAISHIFGSVQLALAGR